MKQSILNLSLLIFLLVGFCSKSLAQISVSTYGGWNWSDYEFAKLYFLERVEAVEGYQFGIQSEWGLSEKWNISTNLQYAVRGYHFFDEFNRGGLSFNEAMIRFDYIDVVPTLEYKPFEFIGINLGIYGSYQLSEKVRRTRQNEWGKRSGFSRTTGRTDLGAYLGLRLQHKKIWLKLGYLYGIQDVYVVDDSTLNIFENGIQDGLEQYNRSLQINLGYQIFTK